MLESSLVSTCAFTDDHNDGTEAKAMWGIITVLTEKKIILIFFPYMLIKHWIC